MNCKSSHTTGRWLVWALPAALLFTLTSCDRRETPVDPAFKNPPPNTAAPTAQYPASTTADTATAVSNEPGPEAKETGGNEAGKLDDGSGKAAADDMLEKGMGSDANAEATPSRTQEDLKYK
jgi:hypothetical protein